MIAANEVRIGNYILDDTGEVIQIKGITEAYKKFLYKREDGYLLEFHSANPIPLTPEILEQFGFEKAGITFYKRIDKTLGLTFTETTIENKFSCEIIYNGYECSIALKNTDYLHNIQNLYWCLSGKELKINL